MSQAVPAPSVFDLNADVGEGFPYDEALLDVVTSANVACGFHAGDETSMRQVCRWAARRGVAVGAQVSYRDRKGFGRRHLDIAPGELRADLMEQLDALTAAAGKCGVSVAYVKPHGALYNRIVTDAEQAAAVVDVAGSRGLPLLGLPGSVVLRQAHAAGVATFREFFADRAYRPDGTLVPREEPDAVITDPAMVADRVVALVTERTVVTVDGSRLAMEADSICVHGDTDDVVRLAATVAEVLSSLGAGPRRFV